MADLSQGSFANVVLNAGESVRVITSGTATVESKYGAPAGTTTVTSNSQVFGPYFVPAKLRVTAVTGSLSYVQGSRVAVTQDPITGEFQPSVSGARTLAAQGAFERELERKGVVLNGSTDDAAGLQAALLAASTPGRRRRFSLPTGDGIAALLGSTLTVDAATMAVDFSGVPIVSAVSDAAAIRVTGPYQPYGNSLSSLSNLYLVGPGEGTASIGVSFDGEALPTGGGPSRSSLRRFFIEGFGEGIRHNHHSYGENISIGEIKDCGYGVRYNPSGLAYDMGESTVYTSVFIYQCANWAVSIEGVHGTWMKMAYCKTDHNQRQIQITNKARLALIEHHMEAEDYTAAPILMTGDGSVLTYVGGEVVVTKASGLTVPHIVDNTSNRGFGGVFFRMPDFYKVQTASGYFATGGGVTRVDGYTCSSDRRQPKLLNANDNCMVDGGFEQSSILDIIQIYGDTTTGDLTAANITTQRSGTNIQIARSTAAPDTGTGHLRVTKVGGTNTLARFFVAVPIYNLDQRGTFRLRMKKSVAGTVTINPVYARLEASTVSGAVGVLVNKSTAGSESALSFTSTAGTYVTVESADIGVKSADSAPWATHYGLFIDCNAMAAGSLDIDNIEIALM